MATPFQFDRAWDFAVTPEELWTTLEQTDQYRVWWPWLREFRVDGDGEADGFRVGATAHLVIQAPLPYQLRCDIHVDEVVRAQTLAAHVTGDLEGPARLELESTPGGAQARLSWVLDVKSSLLRPLARIGPPRVVVGARPDRRARSRAVRGARARDPQGGRMSTLATTQRPGAPSCTSSSSHCTRSRGTTRRSPTSTRTFAADFLSTHDALVSVMVVGEEADGTVRGIGVWEDRESAEAVNSNPAFAAFNDAINPLLAEPAERTELSLVHLFSRAD